MSLNPVEILSNPERLKVLRSTALLDTEPEEPFDVFTRLARRILRTPIALVSLVDADRQFFKSCVGLPEPWATTRQTPLDVSFCRHAVVSGAPIVVEDAREHALVKDNPLVAEGVVAYAGMPLTTRDGYTLGSFCVIDNKPRQWTDDELEILKELSTAVMTEIEWRRNLNVARVAGDAKDQFLALLSHELRTPLSPALMTATALAADETLPEPIKEDIRLIKRNIELEVRLIDDLLDSTRIATGKLRLLIEFVDLHRILEDCVVICEADASAKGIAVSLGLQAIHHQVEGDSAKLHQVFWNVLKNAVKFTPRGGSIAITTWDSEGGRICARITDNGAGISPGILPRLFNAFEQGNTKITQKHGGLGLGLTICKGIVDAHGGSISIASHGEDKGTTVTVNLQVSTDVKPVASKSRLTPVGGENLRILLVEDHLDTLRAMNRLLSKLRYDVITADSILAALTLAGHETFDILISDVGLPDGTGMELMQKLNTMRPTRGIALTGYGMESDIEKTKEAGFARHLVKPIDMAELDRAIREVAGK